MMVLSYIIYSIIVSLHQFSLPSKPFRVPYALWFWSRYNGVALTFLPVLLFCHFGSPRSLCFTPESQQGPGFPPPRLFFSHILCPLL